MRERSRPEKLTEEECVKGLAHHGISGNARHGLRTLHREGVMSGCPGGMAGGCARNGEEVEGGYEEGMAQS